MNGAGPVVVEEYLDVDWPQGGRRAERFTGTGIAGVAWMGAAGDDQPELMVTAEAIAGGVELEVELPDVVLHGRGAAASWAEGARPGDRAAISGPARGYTPDPEAGAYILAGDETAIPAIAQLLEALPAVPVDVHIEIAESGASVDMPAHAQASVTWWEQAGGATPGDTLVPLWPLAVVLLAIALIALVMLLRSRRRPSLSAG